jgi:hypothetical protein
MTVSSQPIITFSKIPNARTGNILLQYFFCIRISILYGHKYVAIEDISANEIPFVKITDSTILLDENIETYHFLCEGFFQRNEFYLPIRERMLAYFATTDDSWIGYSGKREYIRDFLTSNSPFEILPHDIVMSIRLDDFIQLPNPRSDILPPQYYTDILEKWFSYENRSDGRLIIVGDKFRHHWEHKYIEYFDKWSPIIVQNSLMEDFALMRDCPALIHSNSSLCWIASFLSNKTDKCRFIPVTGTYSSQHLEEISSTDVVVRVQPMEHKEVYALNVMCWHRDLKSLPYCIPDELFSEEGVLPLSHETDAQHRGRFFGESSNSDAITNAQRRVTSSHRLRNCPISCKKYVISPLIPGDTSHYLFRAGEEAKYYEMYRLSMFAHTKKKGGWDCLRHYEILAAGCIPIFEDLDKCPEDTLSSFPKTLLKDAYKALLPWRNTEEQRAAYPVYASRLFEFAKEHCSTSANVRGFFRDMSHICIGQFFTPFRIEDAQLAAEHSSLITAREAGVLNEKMCKTEVTSVGLEDRCEASKRIGVSLRETSTAHLFRRENERHPKILMLSGHKGINYTRELNWIGIKRWADSVGTEATEYPPLDFLYDDFPESRLGELYGNGFTYSRRIASRLRHEISEQELIESIQQKKWDIIIYGKVGPDETAIGSIPNLPFWSHVFKRYSRDEIVFWYGGDEMQDMTYANRYSEHLVRSGQYARCFIRELIKWDGHL